MQKQLKEKCEQKLFLDAEIQLLEFGLENSEPIYTPTETAMINLGKRMVESYK